MKTIELGADKREMATKGQRNQARTAGSIPAVVYGGGTPPASVTIDGKKFLQVVKGHGTNVIVNLQVGGKDQLVLLKELQRDFVTHKVVHVDFQRISLTQTLEVNVPLHTVGEAPGVKLGGGILEHILREVRVRATPTNIPDEISLDVSNLQINQGLKVKDIPALKGVEILNDPNGLVVNIVAPSELEEVAPAAAAAVPGAAGAEPEVIAKGKKPEEGEEGAAAPAAGAASAGKAPAAPAAKEKK